MISQRVTLLAVAATMLVAACQKENVPIKTTSEATTNMSSPADSVQERGHALVRVVNAVPAGANVAVQLGDSALFPSVKADAVTDFREVTTNLAKFSVGSSGTSAGLLLAQKDRVLMNGDRYTVVLLADDSSKNVLRVIKDDVIPDSGKARIRILNGSRKVDALDISIAGTKDKFISALPFNGNADFKDLTPSVISLEVRAKDTQPVILTIPKIDLMRGSATTIIISGTKTLRFVKFTDAMMAGTPKA